MKTVMKKMFSLLLVAVLLVSAVPFAVSAAEVTHAEDLTLAAGTYSVDAIKAEYFPDIATTNYWVHCNGPQEDYVAGASFEAAEDRTYTLYVVETVESTPEPAPHTHTPGAAATCTTAQTCTECGEVIAAAKGHTPGAAATCTTAQTCTVCGEVIAAAKGHTPGAASTHTTAQTCTVCGATLTQATGHTDACKVTVNFVDSKNGSQTKTYLPGETVALDTPSWVDGYSFKGWKLNGQYVTSYQIPETACGSAITITADWEATTTLAKYPVSVYARLKIGGIVQDVDLIHYHGTLLENDKILDYLKHPDTLAEIENVIASKYSQYSWSGNFYNAYGSTAATDNITVVDGSKSVYINLTAKQDEVLLYVHTASSTRKYSSLYELDGYKANSVHDTVTSSEVLSFLKGKFGSGISIKMFDEAGFEGYLDGKENTSTKYVSVKDGTTKIHVRLYNASTSSSAAADSSNPKTGDMIMAPAVVLGASFTCLAALFFLNKKRAF